MHSTCECGLLHAMPGGACQDCGTSCCPTCAVQIEAGVYCRWCAIALQPVSA